jgi:hypothetical protein
VIGAVWALALRLRNSSVMAAGMALRGLDICIRKRDQK